MEPTHGCITPYSKLHVRVSALTAVELRVRRSLNKHLLCRARCSEIELSAGNIDELTVRYVIHILLCYLLGIDPQELLADTAGCLSVDIEVRVVCRREECLLIGNRAICDDKRSIGRPCVKDLHVHVARNTADTVSQQERKKHALCLDRPVVLDLQIADKRLCLVTGDDLAVPEAVLEVARTAMEIVLAFILRGR